MSHWLAKWWRWATALVGVVLTFITTPPQEIVNGLQDWGAVAEAIPVPRPGPIQIVGLALILMALWPSLLSAMRGAVRRLTEGKSESVAPAINDEGAATEDTHELEKVYQRAVTAELRANNYEPLHHWAQNLIERERESPNAFLRVDTRVTNAMHLGDNNPYFDFEVNLDYVGALHLEVKGPVTGRLSWSGEALEHQPEPTSVHEEVDGPRAIPLRFRQYVNAATARELIAYLSTHSAVEFTHQLWIPRRVVAPSGEVVFEGGIPLRDLFQRLSKDDQVAFRALAQSKLDTSNG